MHASNVKVMTVRAEEVAVWALMVRISHGSSVVSNTHTVPFEGQFNFFPKVKAV